MNGEWHGLPLKRRCDTEPQSCVRPGSSDRSSSTHHLGMSTQGPEEVKGTREMAMTITYQLEVSSARMMANVGSGVRVNPDARGQAGWLLFTCMHAPPKPCEKLSCQLTRFLL